MQTHAQVWKNAGGSERARNIVAAEFKRALEAPTLDAFDDGRQVRVLLRPQSLFPDCQAPSRPLLALY